MAKSYGPASEKQRLILQDNTTDIILIGGGAGGGKSTTCLIKNLDGIHDPHFRCTIFRRTAPELLRQGGLIDESRSIYSDFDGKFGSQKKLWQFPSGASIAFSAIANDDDLTSWQGAQLVRALIDEAGAGWTEKQVLFLLSRIRSAHSEIHPQLIMSCNPNVNSFLKSWVDFSLDEDTGIPVDGTEKRVRWMVAIDNRVYWADSPEESFELYGEPRGMIYARGMTEDQIEAFPKEKLGLLFMPKSFRFIPTGVFDNPYLLPPRNNDYLANLLSQTLINQRVFLHGSWTARETGSMYFNREWTKIVDSPPINAVSRIRAWDFASEEKTNSNNPDWTCGIKMSRDRYGIYYVEDVVRVQATTDKVLKLVISTAKADGLDECEVCIPIDPAAAGKTAALFYRRTMAEHGVATKTKATGGQSSKLTRFKPLCALAESGSLRVVKADWNDAFFNELEGFSGESKIQKLQKDDQVDAAADAFVMLARQLDLPNMVVPVDTKSNPIPKL